jgi:hypothetical protein
MDFHKQNGHRAQRCDGCDKPFTRNLRGRRKRFCSDACRLEAHRTKKISLLGHAAGLQRNDAKSACGTASFSGGFADRGSRIRGPRRVIEAEISGGLTWREIISTDGVKSFHRVRR